MLNKTIYELCTKDKKLKHFLISKGFENLKDDISFNNFAKMINLESALKMKGIDIDLFISEYKKYKDINCIFERKNNKYIIKGSVPCPVKIPLEEKFKEIVENNDFDLAYDFESANLPIDKLYAELRMGIYPDLITSTGYKMVLDEDIREILEREYTACNLPYHLELNMQGADIKDPRGTFHILAIVPAVFVYNKIKCDNPPKSWEELLSGEYENKLAIPVLDLDMYDALIITIFDKFGIKGIENLSKAYKESMHPAQMLKSNDMDIAIMPYFFASLVDEKKQAVLWPKDGAIVSPLFFLIKKGKEEELKPIIEIILGKDLSEKISANGKFPATSPYAINNLGEKNKFMFASWDVIYRKNIREDLEKYSGIRNIEENKIKTSYINIQKDSYNI